MRLLRSALFPCPKVPDNPAASAAEDGAAVPNEEPSSSTNPANAQTTFSLTNSVACVPESAEKIFPFAADFSPIFVILHSSLSVRNIFSHKKILTYIGQKFCQNGLTANVFL
jgi:hypothetical protein